MSTDSQNIFSDISEPRWPSRYTPGNAVALLGITRTAIAQAEVAFALHSDKADQEQARKDLPETLRCIEHALVSRDAAQAATGTPMFYASPEQATALQDPPGDNEAGVYLPLRKSSAGKFTMPLYATPSAPDAVAEAEQVSLEPWDWLRGVIKGLPHTPSGPIELVARHDVLAWIDEGEMRALAALAAAQGARPKDYLAVQFSRPDAESYCRILRLLGMEEEGDPVEEIERLLALAATPAPEAKPAASQRASEFVVITAASQWACERTVNDWDEGDLMKAIASMQGDWPGCEECDHDCDEPCMPHTVADVHADVDARLAQLVHERKLIAPTGYAPPAGWKPVAMPETRRRPNTVNDQLTASFCDTLDGTRWRRLIAFRDISAERNRQDEQWGGPANDDAHSVIDWQNCIHKQIRQLANEAERRERLVKIAALAIAAVESHDRIRDSSKGGAA